MIKWFNSLEISLAQLGEMVKAPHSVEAFIQTVHNFIAPLPYSGEIQYLIEPAEAEIYGPPPTGFSKVINPPGLLKNNQDPVFFDGQKRITPFVPDHEKLPQLPRLLSHLLSSWLPNGDLLYPGSSIGNILSSAHAPYYILTEEKICSWKRQFSEIPGEILCEFKDFAFACLQSRKEAGEYMHFLRKCTYEKRTYIFIVLKNSKRTVAILIPENLFNSCRVVEDKSEYELLGRFVAGLSHDFNNILTVISMNAETLKYGFEEDALGGIQRAVNNGKNLVERLMDFTKRKNITLKKVGVLQFFKDNKRLFEGIVMPDSRVRFKFRISKETGMLTDPYRLVQIILNLLANARDSMEKKGIITILVSGESSECISVEIHDKGCGILPENMEKIFEPLFTTKPKGRGTGLGLPSSLSLAKEMGGNILVDSVIGKGSVFKVLIPLSDPLKTEK